MFARSESMLPAKLEALLFDCPKSFPRADPACLQDWLDLQIAHGMSVAVHGIFCPGRRRENDLRGRPFRGFWI
jgi:hypothetical protein